MKKIKAFTILELLFVLAIISTLSMLAIPSYKDYLVKTKLTELVLLANKLKLDINEYYYLNGSIPKKYNIEEKNYNYLTKAEFKNGLLEITGDSQKLGLKKSEKVSLIFSPKVNNEELTWECNFSGPKKYLPSICEVKSGAN